LEFHAISAVTGDGVRQLVRSIADTLDRIPKAADETLYDLPTEANEQTETQVPNAPAPSKDL